MFQKNFSSWIFSPRNFNVNTVIANEWQRHPGTCPPLPFFVRQCLTEVAFSFVFILNWEGFFFFQFWQLNLGHHVHQRQALYSWATALSQEREFLFSGYWGGFLLSNVYMFMCMGVGGSDRQPQLLLLRSCLSCFLKQGFSLASNSPCSLVWLTSFPLGIYLSLSPQPWPAF